MKKVIISIIKSVLLMVAGALLYNGSQVIYARIQVKQDLITIEASQDEEELYQLYYKLLQSSNGAQIVHGVLGHCAIASTVEAKLAALKAVEEIDYGFKEPGMSLSYAIVYSPGDPGDVYRELRSRSLNVYDMYCKYNILVPCIAIAGNLHSESSPELIERKIEFLERYLFLDEQELKKAYEEGGADAVSNIAVKRAKQAMPPRLKTNVPYQDQLKMELQKRFGDDAEIEIK